MKNVRMLLNSLLSIVFLASLFLVSVPVALAQTNSDWSEPVNISKSGSAYNPILIVDIEGTFHVIWFDLFDGYKYSKSDDGVTWTESKSVNYPFSPNKTSEQAYSIDDLSQPRFLLDSKGEIHVFWQDKKNKLYHNRTLPERLDNPAVWNGPIVISDSVLDFDAKTDTYEDVHLAFLTNSGTDKDPAGIYYQKFKGTGWLEKVRLYASKYYRSLQPENAHVRIAISSKETNDNLYMVWDDLAQKRIFISSSADAGKTWGVPSVVVEPDEKSGYETPHNAKIDVVGDNILLMWQTGQTGIRCIENSRLSADGGIMWGEVMQPFGDLGICPARISFDVLNSEYSVLSFNIENNLALIAWDGSRWSEMQVQNELSKFQNPLTLEQILLGCQQVSQRNGMFYVVGCDEGPSKDIWFASRALGSMENWFPRLSAWSSTSIVTRVSYKIPSVSSTVDTENNIHVVWTSPSISERSDPEFSIYYAVSNKFEWSRPTPIIINLSGAPNQLSLLSDNQGRLLLAWVDTTNQNLMFSWANSNRANFPPEWSSPLILPVPSKLVSFPSILTDGANNIVVAYSVPFNENRGIYFIKSADLGKNWSAPSQIFDAVAADWDSVDRPRITITGGGRLHTLFTKLSLLSGIHPAGLYYSQSDDGGTTWSDPTEFSDGQVSWSSIVAYDNKVLHLLWQEKIGDATSIYHRISTDNGQTWSSPITVSSTNKKLVMDAATLDVGGQLHLLQLTSDESLVVQEWMWNGSLWNGLENVELPNDLDVVNLQAFCSGITPDNYLHAIAFIEANNMGDNPDNRLISLGRFVDVAEPNQMANIAILPTSIPLLASMDIPVSQVTPTASPLVDINDVPPGGNKNMIGIVIIIVVIVVFMFIIFRPAQLRKRN